jgi:hypothetical protein
VIKNTINIKQPVMKMNCTFNSHSMIAVLKRKTLSNYLIPTTRIGTYHQSNNLSQSSRIGLYNKSKFTAKRKRNHIFSYNKNLIQCSKIRMFNLSKYSFKGSFFASYLRYSDNPEIPCSRIKTSRFFNVIPTKIN